MFPPRTFWFDVGERLSSLGIPHLVTNGGEIRIDCPFCEDKKKHLYMNAQKGVFHCFRCEESGSIRYLFRILEGDEGGDIRLGVLMQADDGEAGDLIEMPDGYCTDFVYDPEGKKALEYLRGRGLEDRIIERYHIGYGAWGKYRGRILIPLFHRGVLVSFVARAYHQGLSPKILNPSSEEAPSPSNYLFNLDQAIFYPKVVLTEGVFDALATGVIDQEYCAVASLGKHLTERQAELLCESGFEELVFAWDTRDAIPQVLYFARALVPFFRSVRVAILPGEEDPSSLGKERMKECVLSAEPFSSVYLKLLCTLKLSKNSIKDINLNGSNGKPKIFKNFL